MDLEPDKSNKKINFDLSFNLGHLFVIFSLFLSAAGLYAHDESRVSVLETRVSALTDANLSPRVAANEAKIITVYTHLDNIKDALLEIRTELAFAHQDTIAVVKQSASKNAEKTKEIETQVDKNAKAIKNRVFP